MPFLATLYSFGAVRATLWRMWYPYIMRRLQGEDVIFLNYGFETEPAVGLSLTEEDEHDRASIQLYHHVASQVELDGRHVLEVSCGHGGGASYLTRTMRPASYTAVDLNPAAIRFCERRHVIEGLTFVRGEAESLPFAAESVDVGINIEASHCYGDFPLFLREVRRVLRAGGYFLYADFRFQDELPDWNRAFTASPLELVHSQPISGAVLRGLNLTAVRSQELVKRCLPQWLQSPGREFAGLPDSRIYDALRNGQVVYHSYCFVKPVGETAPADDVAPGPVT